MAETESEAEAEAEAEAAPQPEPGLQAGPPGVLRERYFVRSNQPLSDLSTPNADAFVTEDKRDPNRSLYALICRPELPARVNVMRALRGVSAMGLQQLVEWGPMTWPPAGRPCMTVIYEKPAGSKVMPTLKSEIRRVDEYEIGRKVIDPLVNAIKEMISRGITHRAIRPTNLYYMDSAGERLAFGDCVSGPPAIDQAVVFETIESGMCNPIGRGSGTYADDLYSLGVTLAFLLLGRNPVAQYDDEAVLTLKIRNGSYATLVGDERLPLPMIEVLRGLLCDDPLQRWDLESLLMWQQGRRLSPLQPRVEKRAARGFPFLGKEYFNCRELAAAFSKNWEQAIPPLLEGKLELWLRRAIEDKERAATVAETVRLALNATGDKKVAADVMLSKILILLDQTAPIRYKGFNIMPDGFGSALAVLLARRGDTRLLVEMIMREVPGLWFEAGADTKRPDTSQTEGNFRELRNFLTTMGMGFGLERCLYELNDGLPCQSSILAEEYVVELKDLLPALNSAAAKRGESRQWPCDRHIAAFMAARARSDINRNLVAINDPDPGKALMALINLLAVFQYRLGPESAPGLAGWIGALCQPVVAAYHNREKRKELEKEIPRLVRRGSIVEIYNLVEDAGAREQDTRGFSWAQAQYQAAEEEIKRILVDDDDRGKEAERTGKQTAAVTGILIGMITVTITVILTVL